MSVSDIIQIVSIVCTSLLSVIAIIISVLTLRKSSKTIIESSRANIMLYFDVSSKSNSYIVLKNFGNSSGKIINIKISPELYPYKGTTMNITNAIDKGIDFTNVVLAPNQAIRTWFPFINHPDKQFQIKLSYKTLGKIYTENYSLNINYVDKLNYLYVKSIDINDDKEALVTINNTLMRLTEKF